MSIDKLVLKEGESVTLVLEKGKAIDLNGKARITTTNSPVNQEYAASILSVQGKKIHFEMYPSKSERYGSRPLTGVIDAKDIAEIRYSQMN